MTIAPDRPRQLTIHDLPKPREGWAAAAACRKAPADIFLDAKRRNTAKSFCDRCPVTTECLNEAIRADDQAAVAGGLTFLERKQWMKDHDIRRPKPGDVDTRAVAVALDAGLTYEAIGATLGIRGETLQRRFQRALDAEAGHLKPDPDWAVREARIVEMRDQEERTWRAIAAEIGCSVGTALGRYRRAKQRAGES